MDFAVRADIAGEIAQRIRAQEDQRVFNAVNDDRVSFDSFVNTVSGVSEAAQSTALTYETLRRAIDQIQNMPQQFSPQQAFDLGGQWAEAHQERARRRPAPREEPTLREIWND